MVLADRYRVVHRLGSGGMATVFLCDDDVLDRQVAVKRLHGYDDPEDRRRFRREARVGAALSHPNLVAVFDTIEDDGSELIVMEYVDGPTLETALAHGPLDPQRAVEVLGDVAAGLDYAHRHGVVHRDVKPANVLLDESGPARLADLGIASASHLTQTATGEMIAGTLAYMAPERLQGEDCGEAGDIYALGAVAFETLSGQRARQATTPAEAVAEAMRGEPPDLRSSWPQAPAGAVAAIQDAMSPDPKQRPGSAAELVERLAQAIEAEQTAPTVALAPVGGRSYRGPLLAGGLVVVLAAVALAATSGGGGSSSGTPNSSAGKTPAPHKTNATAPTTPVSTTPSTSPQPQPQPKPKPTPEPKPKPKPEPKKPKLPADEHKPPGHGGVPPGQAKKGEGDGGD